MGYMKRHAIIVTGDYDAAEKAHEKATEIFPWVSSVGIGLCNDECSFFIPPDGSKEGWRESDLGDERRDKFVAFLRGYGRVRWVEVSYGEDEPDTRVTRADDMKENEK